MTESAGPDPVLLNAGSLAESDIGVCEWDREHNRDALTVSHDGRTIEWEKGKLKGELNRELPPVWVPASTRLHLHSGSYQWDFVVEEMGKAQIGIGFMLLWDVGPDWGFFGYLGSSPTAWAYDPSTGDVVRNTKSIEGNLPRFTNGRSGVVSVQLDLPRKSEGLAKFVVDGISSRPLQMPEGAVVLPAACLLKNGQRVTLARFERT